MNVGNSSVLVTSLERTANYRLSTYRKQKYNKRSGKKSARTWNKAKSTLFRYNLLSLDHRLEEGDTNPFPKEILNRSAKIFMKIGLESSFRGQFVYLNLRII